jgi:hypothetical protein
MASGGDILKLDSSGEIYDLAFSAEGNERKDSKS